MRRQIRIIPARAGPTPVRQGARGGSADHPRSCGANMQGLAKGLGLGGSSPLVRGQPNLRQLRRATERIIPARAGPTQFIHSPQGDVTDHPRSCGANAAVGWSLMLDAGSSPLVRGQQAARRAGRHRLRIIPARAGPTRENAFIQPVHADHPRSCGANSSSFFGLFVWCGSSPLVRGQPVIPLRWFLMSRIIPARAGPTPNITLYSCDRPDHPRSCGANRMTFQKLGFCDGSSPLVRGQLLFLLRLVCVVRIIPARAGPTYRSPSRPPHPTDHPRSCGANREALPQTGYHGGSSPLVRGQQIRQRHRHPIRRIIPARAGPTVQRARKDRQRADHPRSCGANHLFLIQSLTHCGSSPLVRGQPQVRDLKRAKNRIIPARAGPTFFVGHV